MIAAAKAAKEKDSSVDGYLFNGGRWEGTTFDNLAHFWSQGGELVDDEGNPIFAEGKNREYMLNVFRFLKRTVDEGAAPERVVTIKDYAEFLKSAQSRQVAMFQGGSFQYPTMEETPPAGRVQEVGGLRCFPRCRRGQEATGHRRLDDRRILTKDPKKAEMCMSLVKEIYVGGGNRVTNGLPTSEKTLRGGQDLPEADLREVPRVPPGGQGTPRGADLPRDVESAAGRDRRPS